MALELEEGKVIGSSAVAKAGLTLGIIGTGLAALQNNNGGGILGNLFGGGTYDEISDLIAEYLIKHSGDEEKLYQFSKFIEEFFHDLDEEDKEIKHAFKEDIEDFVLEVDKTILGEIINEFKHKDGSVSGLKWACDDVESVVKQFDVITKIEGYDKDYKAKYFWFLMNYVYAVHYNPARNIQGYVELAIDEYCNRVVCFKEMIKHLAEHFEK